MALTTQADRYLDYLGMLMRGYTKIAKLEFLNPNGATAFVLGSNVNTLQSMAFLQSGSLSVNLQNGKRRQLTVTFANVDDEFTFAVDHIWFGREVRYSEGLILSDGSEFYLPQGIFEIETPSEDVKPDGNTITYTFGDKWLNLDGTLLGNLEGDYKCEVGANVFDAMAAILLLDRYDMSGNGDFPIDPMAPVFTSYYNGKTQTLVDGSVVNLTDVPHDILVDGGKTLADVMLALAEILAAWVGYDATGRLTVTPSQDDLLDTQKSVVHEFDMREPQLFEIKSTVNVPDVYNDIIVIGGMIDDYTSARARAQNTNPASATCISRIGLKTTRLNADNVYSDQICQDLAEWHLKRHTILKKSVTIQCVQMFHIRENELVSVVDLNGDKTYYLVQGFTRPVAQDGAMTINCVSVNELQELSQS